MNNERKQDNIINYIIKKENYMFDYVIYNDIVKYSYDSSIIIHKQSIPHKLYEKILVIPVKYFLEKSENNVLNCLPSQGIYILLDSLRVNESINKINFYVGQVKERLTENASIISRIKEHSKNSKPIETVVFIYNEHKNLDWNSLGIWEYTIYKSFKDNKILNILNKQEPSYDRSNKDNINQIININNEFVMPILENIISKIFYDFVLKNDFYLTKENKESKTQIENLDRTSQLESEKLLINTNQIPKETLITNNNQSSTNKIQTFSNNWYVIWSEVLEDGQKIRHKTNVVYKNNLFVLPKGEKIRPTHPKIQPREIRRRNKLFSNTSLSRDFILLKDVEFNSPSAAGSFVMGYFVNGYDTLVNENGIKLSNFREILKMTKNNKDNKEKEDNKYTGSLWHISWLNPFLKQSKIKQKEFTKIYFKEDEFIVPKGEKIRPNTNKTLRSQIEKRDNWIKTKKLSKDFILLEDFKFNKSSGVSTFVLGLSSSGNEVILNEKNIKLGNYLKQKKWYQKTKISRNSNSFINSDLTKWFTTWIDDNRQKHKTTIYYKDGIFILPKNTLIKKSNDNDFYSLLKDKRDKFIKESKLSPDFITLEDLQFKTPSAIHNFITFSKSNGKVYLFNDKTRETFSEYINKKSK
ncbi:uncharacterized protein DUF4357 [Mycoplasmopsis mustelae]|uniref:Uncharacterized protein DUF4357 n=1 Tax=Mycoplasmopsis mustelae TaxID=171289 RepID=A0A4R7UBW7_9BACT|nr:DUF4357 domain-containing protein [Mycoplasmopsis mustelae]TDV23055.1 uncharacterized protein DUF4357 [Mycoplasmopsis mustelae]